MEKIEEKIAVMQAYADGKEIEFQVKGDNRWIDATAPVWNWNAFEYRIKQDVPRTWEEFCEMYGSVENEFYLCTDGEVQMCKKKPRGSWNVDANFLKTREDVEGLLALIKLKRLHDAWCGDWKPDFDDFMTEKSFICKEYYSNDAFDFGVWSGKIRTNHLLIFKTKEIAEDFLTCFKDLIKQAEMWF